MIEKVVVTLSAPVQIGPDDWKQERTSRVFSTTRSLKDMLAWARAEGFNHPRISDLQLSEYTGESL